ncbi:hypothetical protein C8R45DRAFT_947720 [Mycena sanguinolenta]|nr:hypothetical protein C8R45DRAFT_947720 [Mycena sanguinolenta]
MSFTGSELVIVWFKSWKSGRTVNPNAYAFKPKSDSEKNGPIQMISQGNAAYPKLEAEVVLEQILTLPALEQPVCNPLVPIGIRLPAHGGKAAFEKGLLWTLIRWGFSRQICLMRQIPFGLGVVRCGGEGKTTLGAGALGHLIRLRVLPTVPEFCVAIFWTDHLDGPQRAAIDLHDVVNSCACAHRQNVAPRSTSPLACPTRSTRRAATRRTHHFLSSSAQELRSELLKEEHLRLACMGAEKARVLTRACECNRALQTIADGHRADGVHIGLRRTPTFGDDDELLAAALADLEAHDQGEPLVTLREHLVAAQRDADAPHAQRCQCIQHLRAENMFDLAMKLFETVNMGEAGFVPPRVSDLDDFWTRKWFQDIVCHATHLFPPLHLVSPPRREHPERIQEGTRFAAPVRHVRGEIHTTTNRKMGRRDALTARHERAGADASNDGHPGDSANTLCAQVVDV